jgi:predicted RNA-binding protein with TRAM domain
MSYGNRGRSGGYGNRGGGYYGRGGGDRYGGSSSSFGPKPVEAGKEYDVDVTEISRRGDGIAKIQGFIIFVKGAKVGDKIKIKVETVGPRFATASVVGNSDGSGAASTNQPSPSSSSSSSSSSDSSITEPVS